MYKYTKHINMAIKITALV